MSISNRYLIDTNVISELRKKQPDAQVVGFFQAAEPTALYLSVLTLGELRKGAAIKGRTDSSGGAALARWIDELEVNFSDRILVVDAETARAWGKISSDRSRPVVDTLLAATAMQHRLTLVTRNTADVAGIDVSVVNPWLFGESLL